MNHLLKQTSLLLATFACLLLINPLNALHSEDVNNGRIEVREGQRILHLRGTPYEIGFQHGALLKKEIAYNVRRFVNSLDHATDRVSSVYTYFKEALPKILTHLPKELVEEMQGVADGSGVPYKQILLLNLFPEMFHCTGITANGKATREGTLYHVRVLDYAVAEDIQDTAVLAVVKPDNGIPFMNVTYAGFIGCITGMNLEKISIGEIGGKGYGYWDGVPMAMLLRHILQHCASLEEIKSTLETTPRTCEYYYVFADGKSNTSVGVYATYDSLSYIHPGERYKKVPYIPDAFDPVFATDPLFKSANKGTAYDQPDDCIIILRHGFYDLLIDRLNESYGQIGVKELKEAIKEPVSKSSNIHNAIFAPASLDVWISHAGEYGEPACDMPYVHHNLSTLLGE